VSEDSATTVSVQVLPHTAGDAAPGLPTTPAATIDLAPGQAYQVSFAWVPAEGGPGGCTVTTTPTGTPTTTPTATPTGGSDPQGGDSSRDDSGQQNTTGAPGSPTAGDIRVDHTPAAGGPVVAGPVIKDVCAGTVYTTSATAAPTSTDGAS
jgi:hypothetical protein